MDSQDNFYRHHGFYIKSEPDEKYETLKKVTPTFVAENKIGIQFKETDHFNQHKKTQPNLETQIKSYDSLQYYHRKINIKNEPAENNNSTTLIATEFIAEECTDLYENQIILNVEGAQPNQKNYNSYFKMESSNNDSEYLNHEIIIKDEPFDLQTEIVSKFDETEDANLDKNDASEFYQSEEGNNIHRKIQYTRCTIQGFELSDI